MSVSERVWLFRHFESDELQDELYFPAAIFLHTHIVPGCKPWGVSHTEMKLGSNSQPQVSDARQVEPSEPNQGSARNTDSVNVCLCVWIIWFVHGVWCPSPQDNSNKVSVKITGFCCTNWATQPANICLWPGVRNINCLTLLLRKWLCGMMTGQCHINSTQSCYGVVAIAWIAWLI